MRVLVLLRGWHEAPAGPLRTGLIGPVERTVLGTALALADARDDVETAILTAGDEREDVMLAAARERGIDKAYRIWDPLLGQVDGVGVATALAQAAQKLGFDLVLAGMRSADHGEGVLGPAVAEQLSIPHLTGAVSLEWTDGDGAAVRAERWSSGQLFTHEITLPSVVTIADGPDAGPLNPAENPAEVELITFEQIGLSTMLIQPRAHVQGELSQAPPAGLPPKAAAREKVSDGKELVALLARRGLLPRSPSRAEPAPLDAPDAKSARGL